MTVGVCEDIASLGAVKPPRVHVCEACVKTGDSWVHLRTCQSCGVTLCCDSSPNRHATAHFHATDHPVIRSFQPGEEWVWCYPDEIFLVKLTAGSARAFDVSIPRMRACGSGLRSALPQTSPGSVTSRTSCPPTESTRSIMELSSGAKAGSSPALSTHDPRGLNVPLSV